MATINYKDPATGKMVKVSMPMQEYYNKTQQLGERTRLALGLGSNAIPDDAFIGLKKYIDSIDADTIGAISAPVIIDNGNVVVLDNALENSISGIIAYGKTTQAGTPSVSSPYYPTSPGEVSGTTEILVHGKNIFECNNTSAVSKNGVTVTWNKTTQEFTFNGTWSAAGDIALVTNFDPHWNIGKQYTVSVTHVDGEVTLGSTSSTTFAWSIFSKNASKFMRGSTSLKALPEKYVFSGTAFEGFGGGFNFYLQCWSVGTVFNNYKVKIQIEEGATSTDWVKYTKYSKLTINTPDGLMGLPVSTGGNYTDTDGQQWICDTIDFERGVYIKRIGKIVEYASEDIGTPYISSTGELSTGATVVYKLSSYVETDLDDSIMSSFLSIENGTNSTFISSEADIEVKLAGISATTYKHSTIDQLRADIDYIAVMSGVNL